MSFLMIALFLGSFQVTAYQSVPQQTRPHGYYWTASGEKVNVHGVAVSQDMLEKNGGQLKFGDMVYIEGVGLKFVNDTMNKRHKQKLDVWVMNFDEEKRFDNKFRGKKLRMWLIRVPKGEIK
jgi:3D (Asp-Asp-Asp) domain-containing protein